MMDMETPMNTTHVDKLRVQPESNFSPFMIHPSGLGTLLTNPCLVRMATRNVQIYQCRGSQIVKQVSNKPRPIAVYCHKHLVIHHHMGSILKPVDQGHWTPRGFQYKHGATMCNQRRELCGSYNKKNAILLKKCASRVCRRRTVMARGDELTTHSPHQTTRCPRRSPSVEALHVADRLLQNGLHEVLSESLGLGRAPLRY